jgi:hypothetical protein
MDSRTSSPTKLTRVRLARTQKPVVPEEVRSLLGPSWIIEGEDPERYEKLLAAVGEAVQPKDLIDWLLVKDIVALTWEIQRTRWQRDSLMRMALKAAMKNSLGAVLPWSPEGNSEAQELVLDWLNGDKKAIKRVDELLAKSGLTTADFAAQSLSEKVREFDRLDAHNQRHEDRRDALLQQIERRRPGWANKVKSASEDIVDAEFKESTPNAITGRTRQVTGGQR